MNDLTLKAEFIVATTDRVVRAPIRRPVVLGVLLALSMGIGVGYSARSYSAAIEIEVAPPAPGGLRLGAGVLGVERPRTRLARRPLDP
jgi:hypothetical protein